MSAEADDELAPKVVGAVANAVSILRWLAQLSEPAGVAAISRHTGITVSTCFNILRTLASERLVVFDPVGKTYRIGMGVLEFTVPLLGANPGDLIRPELERLSGAHKSLICLWQVTDGGRLVLIDRVSSVKTVRVDMAHGARLPVYVGAVGRCCAAHARLSSEALKTHFAALQWQAPPSFETYAREVEQARADGFAFDFGQLFIGLEIAGAVATDATGKPRLGLSGISIAGQVPRDEMQRLGRALRESADWISEVLFAAPKGRRQSDRRAAS